MRIWIVALNVVGFLCLWAALGVLLYEPPVLELFREPVSIILGALGIGALVYANSEPRRNTPKGNRGEEARGSGMIPDDKLWHILRRPLTGCEMMTIGKVLFYTVMLVAIVTLTVVLAKNAKNEPHPECYQGVHLTNVCDDQGVISWIPVGEHNSDNHRADDKLETIEDLKRVLKERRENNPP